MSHATPNQDRPDALDTLDRARCMVSFLAWAASARDALQHFDAMRRHLPQDVRDAMPPSPQYSEPVSTGCQWAYVHLDDLLERAALALPRIHAARHTD